VRRGRQRERAKRARQRQRRAGGVASALGDIGIAFAGEPASTGDEECEASAPRSRNNCIAGHVFGFPDLPLAISFWFGPPTGYKSRACATPAPFPPLTWAVLSRPLASRRRSSTSPRDGCNARLGQTYARRRATASARSRRGRQSADVEDLMRLPLATHEGEVSGPAEERSPLPVQGEPKLLAEPMIICPAGSDKPARYSETSVSPARHWRAPQQRTPDPIGEIPPNGSMRAGGAPGMRASDDARTPPRLRVSGGPTCALRQASAHCDQ
jgi:hypothetical protein